MPDPSLIFTAPIIQGSGAARKENCSVELLGLAIYGDYRHGYRLPCIDPGCQALVVAVQDRLPEADRQSRRWRLLIARLATCQNTGSERVARRMALWAARRVEHLNPDPRVKACNDVSERWLAGEASDSELRTAAVAVAAVVVVAAAAAVEAGARMEFVDDYLTAWSKVAADEGCLIPDEADAEYLAFLAALDFMEGSQPNGS